MINFTFNPHLIPTYRGILTSMYVQLTSKTNAKIRIGFDTSNQNINDIIFNNIFNNFKKFREQLLKYLNFLK